MSEFSPKPLEAPAPGNSPEKPKSSWDSFPLIREEGGGVEGEQQPDFRDTTIFVVRHGDVEDKRNPNSGLSQLGIEQAQKIAKKLISQLRGVKEKEVVIKFYTSPRPRATKTAEKIIGVFREAEEKGELPEGVELLKATPKQEKPVPRKRLPLDMVRLTKKDVEAILGKYGGKKEGEKAALDEGKGEKAVPGGEGEKEKGGEGEKEVTFASVWNGMAGELGEGSEKPEDVKRRFEEWIRYLQKVISRINPKGPKLVIIVVTHSVVALPVSGEEPGTGEAFRIDFPRNEEENTRLITKGGRVVDL